MGCIGRALGVYLGGTLTGMPIQGTRLGGSWMRVCEGGPLLIMIRFLMHFVMVVCVILSSGHGLSLNHCLEKSIQQLTSSRSCFTLGQPDGLFCASRRGHVRLKVSPKNRCPEILWSSAVKVGTPYVSHRTSPIAVEQIRRRLEPAKGTVQLPRNSNAEYQARTIEDS